MKITFLGTSHGVPGKDRFCSSLILEVGDRAYLIDGGAPVGDILMRNDFDFDRIKAVFTSHAHSDHTYGMLQFISLCNWRFKTTDMDIYYTEQILADAVKNLLLASDKKFEEERLRNKIITEGEIYNDGNLKVTAVETKHMHPYPSYTLIFEAEGKRFIYTGDLNSECFDFPKIAMEEPSDLIVSEAAHFDISVILEKLLSCPTKNVAIVHIARDIKAALQLVEDTNKTAQIPVWAPNDGDEIEI